MKNLTYIQLQKNNEEHYKLFESLMLPYFDEIHVQLSNDIILKMTLGILNMQGVYDRHLEVCYDDSHIIGFLYGKVDHEGHRGFIKPDYGYIMEFYVKPEFRCKGYGKSMFERLEYLFASHGTKRMWLTAAITGIAFWEAMGFKDIQEYCPENKLLIFEKDVLF